MKKAKKVKEETAEYTCNTCAYKHTVKYDGWKPKIACPKCGGTAQYSNIVESGDAPGFRRYAELTAQGYDKKTGEPFWLNKKGKRLKYWDSSVRYNIPEDPHGWRATGKKVRDRDAKGRKQ